MSLIHTIKKITPGIIAILLSLWLCFAAICQEYNLTVYIKDLAQSPIEGAVLFIDDDIENVSGSDGIVAFTLASGNYILYSYAPGFLDHISQVTISNQDKSLYVIHKPAIFWSTSPANPPVGVGEANGVRLATADGRVYMHTAFGGTPGTNNYGANSDFYSYEPQYNTWIQHPNAPHFGSYGISTTNGPTLDGEDAIYIIRGYWTGQRTWFARYNITHGTWETGLNHQIPWRLDLGNQYSGSGFQNYPRNGSVMIWDQNDNIFLFPGSGYGYEKYDWYRYSVSNDTWQDMGELPHKQGPGNAAIFVQGSAIGENQDYIYVQFGLTPSGSYTDAEFWRYGLSDGIWQNLADHGYGADDGSMLAWNGSNYIYHTPGAFAEQPWDKGLSQKRELMRYSISGNYWSHMEYTPYNRWGGWDDAGGIVIIGDTLYGLKGGSDVVWAVDSTISGGGSVSSNKFWKFTLHQNTIDLEIMPVQGHGRTYPRQGRFTYLSGSQVDLLAIPDSGWRFEYWNVNNQLYSDANPIEYPLSDPTSVQAVFVPDDSSVAEIDESQIRIYIHQNRLFVHALILFKELSVYDTTGRHVAKFTLGSEGSFDFELDITPGVYILSATAETGIFSKTILVR